jgi:hypothetical protein
MTIYTLFSFFTKTKESIESANKQLVTIFEQKIKDKINEVWGVERELEQP